MPRAGILLIIMLKRLEIAGFKSFARKTVLDFSSNVTSIVGPNGSGKSNITEAFRFALGEQSMKSMRGKKTEDLIFSGSHSAPRSNRAGVAIVFDNTKRVFKLDFDEVVIERAIFRDGTGEYSINGSKARLRDIHELLASANIGESAHHIISQGEADRILLASSRVRREMLEDALGLQTYEFKKQEAIRRLDKTEVNITQVEALRNELSPHLRFLSRQVEKLERSDLLRQDLIKQSQKYLAIEDSYIEKENETASAALNSASQRLATVSNELLRIESSTLHDEEGERLVKTVRDAEEAFERATAEHTALSREVGRVDGTLAVVESRLEEVSKDRYVRISRDDLSVLREAVEKHILEAENDTNAISGALVAVRTLVRAFFERFSPASGTPTEKEKSEVQTLMEDKVILGAREATLSAKIEKLRNTLQRAREDAMTYEETSREEKRRLLKYAEEKAREEAVVLKTKSKIEALRLRREACEKDKAELLSVAGSEAVSYAPLLEVSEEDIFGQEERHHNIERLKIRLEEAGGTGEDVRKEHEDAVKREEFLSRELTDLEHSAKSLRELIESLEEELAKTFTEGLARVNSSFREFFSLMFGGGSAELVLEELPEVSFEGVSDEEQLSARDARSGIDIVVHMPKKNVQTLTQLSGGERALTSIALIFAMSQVNPPPFLILDETDAALDEANSRRYGDMIENLAKKSQLIVVTHNRETMSRAGILYGVTMGNDGISKMLSVKFEDAVAVAK